MDDSEIPKYDLDEHAKHFARTFGNSLISIEDLKKTLIECLVESKRGDVADVVIFLLSAACLRDFTGIRLLATRELGTQSLQLIRVLYERVVTLSYLAQHPSEIQDFIDYSDVHWHKLLSEAQIAFGDDQSAMARIVSPGEAEIITAKFEAAKERFQQTNCKKCKAKGLQPSWTKKGMPELAGALSKEIRALYFKAFLSPTQHIHTTFRGVMQHYMMGPDGQVVVNEAFELESSREAMDMAHILLIQLLAIVNTHFKLGKSEVVTVRAAEMAQSWKETLPL